MYVHVVGYRHTTANMGKCVLQLYACFCDHLIVNAHCTSKSPLCECVVTCIGGQSRSRLQQLVSWCGGETFDGCLVFDECHKAKNFNPGKEERSTKVALAVSMVQKMLPRARVLYCSATGVSDVKNMVMHVSQW